MMNSRYKLNEKINLLELNNLLLNNKLKQLQLENNSLKSENEKLNNSNYKLKQLQLENELLKIENKKLNEKYLKETNNYKEKFIYYKYKIENYKIDNYKLKEQLNNNNIKKSKSYCRCTINKNTFLNLYYKIYNYMYKLFI